MGNLGTCGRPDPETPDPDSPLEKKQQKPSASPGLAVCPGKGARHAQTDEEDLPRLLDNLEQLTKKIATQYRLAAMSPQTNAGAVSKADDVLRRVSQHLRSLQQYKVRGRTWQGEEADRWLDMWTGRKRRFRGLADIAKKVQVENRIVRHWQGYAAEARFIRKASTGLDLLGEDTRSTSDFKLDDWDKVDLFEIERDCHRPLTTVFMSVWHHRRLAQLSRARNDKVTDFIIEVESSYRDVPYHNRIHAAEVTAAAYYFWSSIVRRPELEGYFTQIDLLVLLFAAAIHDMDHPGVNNNFLVNTRDFLAIRYHDRAVLENFHCASAFELLKAKDVPIFEHRLPSPPTGSLRNRVVDMVLATDMAVHKTMVEQLEGEVDRHKNPQDIDKRLVEHGLLHLADLGHSFKSCPQHQDWARRVSEEFFQQGDREKELGLVPITLNDRLKAPTLPKGQIGFLNFVVMPLWKPLASMLGPFADEPYAGLCSNLSAWEEFALQDEMAVKVAAGGS